MIKLFFGLFNTLLGSVAIIGISVSFVFNAATTLEPFDAEDRIFFAKLFYFPHLRPAFIINASGQAKRDGTLTLLMKAYACFQFSIYALLVFIYIN